MTEFLAVMEANHHMTWDDFWTLKIGTDEPGPDGEYHWEDYNNTPTTASIKVMEMFGAFVKAVNPEQV